MAEFTFKCPQCGQEIEADESFRGQVAPCPFCEKNIVIPKAKTRVTVSKPKSKQPVTWKRSQPSISQGVSGYAPMGGLSNTEPPQRGFLSPRGRASRRQFLIIYGIVVLFALLGHFASFIQVLLIPLGIGLVVFSWCLWTRRLHDLNRSDYWLLPYIAGEVTCKALGVGQISTILMSLLWLSWSIVLGSLDGTPGDNDYGRDPKGRVGTGEQTNTSKIAIWILSAVSVLVSVVAIATRNMMPVTALQEDMEQRELRQSVSDEKEGKSSSDDVDMVTVGGVLIRRLFNTEFTKVTDENGNEMFRAALPEEDGFTPGVNILFLDFDVNSNDLPKTPRQKKELMDVVFAGALEKSKELEEQGVLVDMEIVDRSDNTVTFFMKLKEHYSYHKQIVDVRNGRIRIVAVAGLWKLNKDKNIIKACVDSARLAAP